MLIESFVEYSETLVQVLMFQLLVWIFIQKSGNRYKLRYRSIKDYPNLKPFAKTWVVVLVIIAISLIAPIIFDFLFEKSIHTFLTDQDQKVIFLFGALASFEALWLGHYVFEKKFDIISLLLIGVILLCLSWGGYIQVS